VNLVVFFWFEPRKLVLDRTRGRLLPFSASSAVFVGTLFFFLHDDDPVHTFAVRRMNDLGRWMPDVVRHTWERSADHLKEKYTQIPISRARGVLLIGRWGTARPPAFLAPIIIVCALVVQRERSEERPAQGTQGARFVITARRPRERNRLLLEATEIEQDCPAILASAPRWIGNHSGSGKEAHSCLHAAAAAAMCSRTTTATINSVRGQPHM